MSEIDYKVSVALELYQRYKREGLQVVAELLNGLDIAVVPDPTNQHAAVLTAICAKVLPSNWDYRVESFYGRDPMVFVTQIYD